MSSITIDRLTKHYGAVRAVDDLSFSLGAGSITGFVGANGAGKSTTLRMLLGVTRPTSGTARIEGHRYVELRNPTRLVGALLDPDVFHPRRRGRDALGVLAAAGNISDRRVEEVLELVGMSDAAHRRVSGYSMGMRQRLGLAAALLGDPPILVLDEPANGLDPMGVRWLRTLLRDLADEGRTVLVSSHQLAELAQTVDDVVVIDHGRLIADGPMRDLITEGGATSLEDLFLELVQKGHS
ncbi:ABC transporter ATP-binding protein [Nocardioides mesophilus]|uniref:ATP-binding cassette domain-containing protein n=1 Tax=Nocardioides mesophilus TaxID=433659 RepID=A0A7G9R879_9ACTN|nr:ATP-binding cassette domain-containing protein [Nocardioides mesophilus]QNN51804.1 ATP-binding cassette domain-containing protein [Nocardioides mesophilus]